MDKIGIGILILGTIGVLMITESGK